MRGTVDWSSCIFMERQEIVVHKTISLYKTDENNIARYFFL